VDQDVSLAGAGGADGEFTVSAVHGIPIRLSLEML
jgi:hypothetical protein